MLFPNESEILRKMRFIEGLKAGLVTSVGQLCQAMAQNSEQAILKGLAVLVVVNDGCLLALAEPTKPTASACVSQPEALPCQRKAQSRKSSSHKASRVIWQACRLHHLQAAVCRLHAPYSGNNHANTCCC